MSYGWVTNSRLRKHRVYFASNRTGRDEVWKVSAEGGEAVRVATRAFSLVNDGIYFIAEPSADRKSFIQFLSFATGTVKTVAPLSGSSAEGLSVSPDG